MAEMVLGKQPDDYNLETIRGPLYMTLSEETNDQHQDLIWECLKQVSVWCYC